MVHENVLDKKFADKIKNKKVRENYHEIIAINKVVKNQIKKKKNRKIERKEFKKKKVSKLKEKCSNKKHGLKFNKLGEIIRR